MITLESILLEADKIDGTPEAAAEDEEDVGTDYTDTGDEETEADPEANDDADASGDDGMDEEDMPEDTGDDEGGDEATDYTEDEDTSDDGTDDTSDGSDDTGDSDGMDDGSSDGNGPESEDQLRERDRKVKSYMLLKEMTRLYHAIKAFTEKVSTQDKKNILFSAIQKNVVTNFNRLSRLVYNYIMYYYDHMSYEYNLYAYNYFVETCKVNIEMMNKIIDKDDVEYS